MMENRNEYGTPREWIDDDILAKILGSDDADSNCGCYGISEERNTRGNSKCGCSDQNHAGETAGCGSNRNHKNAVNSRSQSCGCGRSTRENRSSCRRDRRSDNTSDRICGYANNHREYDDTGCGCESCANDDRMSSFPIAMAYVPYQEWRDIYDADDALNHGTLFSELNLPFNHSACGKNCGCK